MDAVTFLIKPASGLCNMRCRYCFYEDVSDRRQTKNMGLMTRDTARAVIEAGFAYAGPGGTVQFVFQGGEPTLAGLDFFRDFVSMTDSDRPEAAQVSYSIQTNGQTLDKDWVLFFKEHDFLVGLSMDGTQKLHDRHRRDAAGNGTWTRTAKALALLDSEGVETNILCVVTGPAARAPREVYRSLKKLGSHALQFIPCLDPLDSARGGERWSLTPADYGNFLKNLFDAWYEDLTKGLYVSVRQFDDYLRLLVGMPPSSCAAAGRCGGYLAVEANGGLYPCDFYVLDRWHVGNIHEMSVAEALASPEMKAFLSEGDARPSACRQCPYAPLCRGGCKRDWVLSPAWPENYYCQSYRDFFAYALPRLRRAATILFGGRR